jgi:CelD/BcsL family acetyltransferase involved in cellulose biosynthesis
VSSGGLVASVTTVELLQDRAGLEAVRPEWDQLAVECARPGSSPDLLLAWWHHLAPRSGAARVVAVRDGGRLVGLAPFLVFPGPRGRPVARLFGTPAMPQRAAILAAAGYGSSVTAAVAAALGRSRPGLSAVLLDRIDAGAPGPENIARAWPGALRARYLWEQRVPAPGISLDRPDYAGWLAARSPGLRRAIARTARRLEDRGGRITRAEDPSAARRGIAAFGRLHFSRFGERSTLWRPDALAMLGDAGDRMVGSGRMRLYTVEGPDGTIAALILFAAGGEVVAWNAGWHPDWARERPSSALLYRAIEDCFALGDRRLDLGDGDDAYKTRLADHDRPVAWGAILPRGLSYPVTRTATAPRRLRGRARTMARLLPPGAERRLIGIRRRLRSP